MKRNTCVLYLLTIILASFSALSAQNGGGLVEKEKVIIERTSIFDALEKSDFGKGEVIIQQPVPVRKLVGERMYGANVETTDSLTYLKIQGFRTQVFSGNNQRASKEEAFNKEKEIKELYPEVSTYVSYNAPFWKLRVGDFRTHEEAYHMKRMLMEAFPAYGKEMYIVREEIRIPLN